MIRSRKNQYMEENETEKKTTLNGAIHSCKYLAEIYEAKAEKLYTDEEDIKECNDWAEFYSEIAKMLMELRRYITLDRIKKMMRKDD